MMSNRGQTLPPPPKYLAFFGDSITNGKADDPPLGWAARCVTLLAQDKPGVYGYYNGAISGFSTVDCYYTMNAVAQRIAPHALIIAVGVNDVMRRGAQAAQESTAFSVERRAEYWERLLIAAKEYTTNVLVMGILSVDETRLPIQHRLGPYGFLNTDIDVYNKQLVQLAAEAGVTYVPWQDHIDRAAWSTMLADGVHPNAAGHAHLAQVAYRLLRERL
jgi:lysophospholipase L1-like esterase